MAAAGQEFYLPHAAPHGVLERPDRGQQRHRVRPPAGQETGVVEEHRVVLFQPHLDRDRLVGHPNRPDPDLSKLGQPGRNLANEGTPVRMVEVIIVGNPHAGFGPLAVQVEQKRQGGRNLGGRGGHVEAVGLAPAHHEARIVAHIVAHALVETCDQRLPAGGHPSVIEDHALAAIGDASRHPFRQWVALGEAGDEHRAPGTGLQPAGQALEQRHPAVSRKQELPLLGEAVRQAVAFPAEGEQHR